jgi:hypothetical protein
MDISDSKPPRNHDRAANNSCHGIPLWPKRGKSEKVSSFLRLYFAPIGSFCGTFIQTCRFSR